MQLFKNSSLLTQFLKILITLMLNLLRQLKGDLPFHDNYPGKLGNYVLLNDPGEGKDLT